MFKKRRRRNITATEKTQTAASNRRRKSRKKYTIYYFLFFITALIVGAVLCLSVFFKIQTITLTGQDRYSDAQIKSASGVMLEDNLIRISRSSIKEKLTSEFVYIKDVIIHRQFPDTLNIELVMAIPVLQIEYLNDSYLLSDTARVLEINGTNTVPCPRIVGFDLSMISLGDYLNDEQKANFDSLITAVGTLIQLNSPVDLIDISNPMNINMLYDGRLAICFGSGNDFDYKIRFAQAAISSHVEDTFVGILDVSTRPNARLKPLNILTEQYWPFPSYLFEDYKKIIEKPENLLIFEGAPENEIAQEPVTE